jgi:glycerophosphoryl diester phosphodiesterase
VTDIGVHAHRGSPDDASGVVENTLPAFARARDLGADGVELDARLTADGIVVVHHDPVVPGAGPVAELRADELPDWVPTLVAALDACDGMTVNVEVKGFPGEPGFDPDNGLARDVARLVARSGRVSDGVVSGVVVSSFWPDALTAVHEAVADWALPAIPTGLLVASWFDSADIVPTAVSRSCAAVHPVAALVTEALVDEARTAGLAVATWTVNERSELERMSKLGVDTVITDDVGLALDVLGRARS